MPENDIDSRLTRSFADVYHQLGSTPTAVPPISLIQLLRDKYPQFAQQSSSGGYQQQDAEECLNCLLSTSKRKVHFKEGQTIDSLFSFKLRTSVKCLEDETDEEKIDEEVAHKLSCFMGDQIIPVSIMTQGISLALNETIEKMSPSLGRNAAFSKKMRLQSLPEYLTVHFVRFEWKGSSASAGTAATKAKVCRKVEFSRKFDVFEFCSKELQDKLSVGRHLELDRDQLASDCRNSKKPAAEAEVKEPVTSSKPEEDMIEYDTGSYELQSIVTHQGRAADSGHYISWVRLTEDEWYKFDDEKVSEHKWKDVDLTGGRNDFHIAYLLLLKKVGFRGPRNAEKPVQTDDE